MTSQRIAALDSIEPALLNAVVGGGPSLGDRDARPPEPNSWAAPLDRLASTPDGLSSTIDRGMTLRPDNPSMDEGIWQLPSSISGGASDLEI